jgi:hypothetical protein
MEKKLSLFGMLGVIVILAISTMGFVKYQRTPRVASSPAAPLLACATGDSAGNYRSPKVWNGFLIPPADATGSLESPANICLPQERASNFRLSQTVNGIFIPSRDVTASLADPVNTNQTVWPQTNFRLAQKWNGFVIPSMEVTGSLEDPRNGYLPAKFLLSIRVPPKVFSGH